MKSIDQYPIDLPIRLTAVLKRMRRAKGLTETAAGRLIGVSGKRIARLEEHPGNARFDLFARYVEALGGRINISQAARPR